MKKYKYILFTSGRGPIECSLAVHGIQKRFRRFLETKELKYSIIQQSLGDVKQSLDTIVFKVESNDFMNEWIGTLQWVCTSPIRKFSKRKNWFVKSCEVFKSDEKKLEKGDVEIQSYKASGPGGQHRNKVETAIRVIHRSSGLMVTASESRSKIQNLNLAMRKLEAKLSEENSKRESEFNTQEWLSKLTIERGNPKKVFYGLKFDRKE